MHYGKKGVQNKVHVSKSTTFVNLGSIVHSKANSHQRRSRWLTKARSPPIFLQEKFCYLPFNITILPCKLHKNKINFKMFLGKKGKEKGQYNCFANFFGIWRSLVSFSFPNPMPNKRR